MAKKKVEPDKATQDKKDLLKRIHERFEVMEESDRDNRQQAMQDLKFATVPGEQWDALMRKERGQRPCYEFNKIRVSIKRVINDMRANRTQGKVRAVEGGDVETAEVFEGLIRNVWNVSDGDTVVDFAAEYQVAAGMGAWRIETKYSDDTAFNQDVVITPILNPFCLYADPSAKDMLKRDADDWILTERISRKEYEARWPKAEVVPFEGMEYDKTSDWQDDQEVRICEYWYKKPVTKTIYLLNDGQVVDEKDVTDPAAVKSKRVVNTNEIWMCIASGDAILEGPTKWAGSIFPFVMVYGEYLVIEGKPTWYGLTRFAKDAQKSYNLSRTAIAETIAQAPQAKWWATVEQAKGNTDKWAEAHQKNFPFLLYNADPKAPGVPSRIGGADVPVALIQESQIASDEIKSVTGIYDASLGNQGNETSGIAIRARASQGDMATFNFRDNLAKGIRRTWEILIDLIPKIYDTEREMRILGSDGAEDYVKINATSIGEDGMPVIVNDLAVGKFDVAITTGPSFATQRQEAAETYLQLAQASPQVMGLASDLIFKSMDLPYADDIAERMQVMLPPQIQAMINKDKTVSPEVTQMMGQVQQAMTMVQAQMQAVQDAGLQVQQEKAGVDKTKSEVEKLIANLKTQEAQFEAQVAKELAKVASEQSKLQIAELQQGQQASQQGVQMLSEDRDMLMQQVHASMQVIAALTDNFSQQAQQAIANMQATQAQKPKVVRVESHREKGKLVAVPIYE